MRVQSIFLVLSLLFVATLAQIQAPTAIPEPASTTPVPASTPVPVTTTDPLTPPIQADPVVPAKQTPGRHCELRNGCGECLAISYCVWSPSSSRCVDKKDATRKDDVVTTCDPVVCARHGGAPVPADARKAAHTTAKLAGVRGRPVIAEAEVVERLAPKKKYNPLPHLSRKNRKVTLPRTTSDDPHVHILPGRKAFVFTSDNRGPIIRGEAEERKAQYEAEKKLHRKLKIKALLQAQNLLAAKKANKYLTPKYYPSAEEKLAKHNKEKLRLLRENERVARDQQLRQQLLSLRKQADGALAAKSNLVASKRNKIEDLLNRLSAEIDKVNRQAQLIDTDDRAFEKISKDVTALTAKVKNVCTVTFSLLEEQSQEQSDSEVDAETASEVESELDSEIESETEGFESE